MIRGIVIMAGSLVTAGAATTSAVIASEQSQNAVPEWVTMSTVIAACTLCFYVGLTIQSLKDGIFQLRTLNQEMRSQNVEMQKDLKALKSGFNNHETRLSILEKATME